MTSGVKVIRSLKDPKAADFIRLSLDKGLRYSWKKTIISTPTLISDLGKRFEFEDLILDKKPKDTIPFKYKNLHVFTPDIICRIGQLKNSRAGILATLPIPPPVSVETFEPKKWLILDGISDLGDLGAIIRSAAAFDWTGIWLTHTCGDPFDPVCIRASQGALFSLPYRIGSIQNAMKHARRDPSILKLRVIEGSDGGDLSGPNDPTRHSSICLLVQKPYTDSIKPSDFQALRMDGVEHPSKMPIAITASAAMMSVGGHSSIG